MEVNTYTYFNSKKVKTL